MVFRKYYYIDEDFVNDAYASIHGFDFDNQEVTEISRDGKGGNFGFNKVVNVSANLEKGSDETVKYNANITPSSKLQSVLNYIKSEEGDIPYYESIDNDIFSSLTRDTFFEGVFNLKFSKIETFAHLFDIFENFDAILDLGVVNEHKEIKQIQDVAKVEREKGLVCILNFLYDNKFPCYMYLNEKFLRTEPSQLQNEVTVICKVARLIPKGKTINLTNLTELTKLKVPDLNTQKGRTQQIQNIKSGNKSSVKQFQDEIKGPAIEIVPIAIYK